MMTTLMYRGFEVIPASDEAPVAANDTRIYRGVSYVAKPAVAASHAATGLVYRGITYRRTADGDIIPEFAHVDSGKAAAFA